jgi:hypothetical protein
MERECIWASQREKRLEEGEGGRAAFAPRAVESYAGSGLGLEPEGGMAEDFSEDQRCGGKGEIVVAEWCDYRWIGGAALWNCRELCSG